MKNVKIFAETEQSQIQLLTLLQLEGYHWNWSDHRTPQAYAEAYCEVYPIVSLDKKKVSSYGMKSAHDYRWPEDATAIINIINNESSVIIIPNVGDYEAAIRTDGVEINGYTIPFDKIAEIEESVKKIKEN